MTLVTADAKGGILIIGAGLAGLYTALRLAPHPVTLITSGQMGRRAASSWAQGGLAAAIGTDDSAQLHIEDTITAGAGLVDVEAATVLCREGPMRIADLEILGVPFDRAPNGMLKLGREAAHRRDRIVHVGGDEAGAAIMDVLMERAIAADHIDIRERHVAHRLITDNGRVVGAMMWDADAEAHTFLRAHQTVLATGGAGGLFAVTTNPLTATAQGMSMAYRAGATLRDVEFVQFHPTGLDIGRDPAPLATEALRGEGAILCDAHGRRFMKTIHPDAELAPRDVVARGVAQAIATTGQAFLDARQAIGRHFKSRFPTVYHACMDANIDPTILPIPVAPAAHYHMGGVLTDLFGRTTLEGLWAVGEVASTGVHGSNRLASNSLLEALVFGGRCADALSDLDRDEEFSRLIPEAPVLPPKPAQSIAPYRKQMAATCGLLRHADGLNAMLKSLSGAVPQTIGDDMALQSMSLVTRAALAREESRGAHQRTDFQEMMSPQHSLMVGETIQFAPLNAPQEPHYV